MLCMARTRGDKYPLALGMEKAPTPGQRIPEESTREQF